MNITFSETPKADAVQKITENAEKNETFEMFGHKQKWWKNLSYLLSYPAYETPMFNENGVNLFRSKTMFLIFLPSMIAIFVVIYIFIAPNIFDCII